MNKKLISLITFLFMLSGCSQKAANFPKATKYTSAARHKACMRDYTVLGKKYTPTYVSVGDTMEGISSWYGPNFHGKYTSNGEVYNMYKRTAAHKTWPMDTIVKVTNLDNGKSTVVRINDRGPFVKGRIIDCSYRAGKDLGLDKTGIAHVKLEVLGFATDSSTKKHTKTKSKPTKSVKLRNFGVQVGAFSNYSGAKKIQQKYNKLYPSYKTIIKKFGDLYRVWMMGFDTKQQAIDFRDESNINGPIVIL
jgi:rare lipoprotein A